MEGVTLRGVMAIFGKAGATTFGGGDPTMAALQRDIFERRKWLDLEQYALCYSVARITPGTNVLAFCAAVGYLLRGWAGSIGAVLAASVPAAAIVIWLTLAFESAERNFWTRQALVGVLAAVTGMMASAVITLWRPTIRNRGWLRIAVFTGGALALVFGLGWPPVPVMLVAAVGGAFWPERPLG